MSDAQNKAMEKAAAKIKLLKEFAETLKEDGFVMAVIVAQMNEHVGQVRVIGANSHKEALPIFDMAKAICAGADNDPHQNMKIDPVKKS
jgi:TRAP-type mannitol/chloroaromatic compound transport system substrate-binding protein